MPTQVEIGAHLDLSQGEVSRWLHEAGIDWKETPLDTIRIAYIRKLRSAAAGHKSADGGMDLTSERVLTERVDRELKQYELAEKKKQLVRVDQLEAELSRMVGAFRTELLARDDKLRSEIEALYGIDIDPQLLEDHTRAALAQLARYDPDSAGAGEAPGDAGGADGEDDDDGMGASAPSHVREERGEAGDLQP